MAGKISFWTPEVIEFAKTVLRDSRTTSEAVAKFNAARKTHITHASLVTAFRDRGAGPVGQFLRTGSKGRKHSRAKVREIHDGEPPPQQADATPVVAATVDDLVALVKKASRKGGLTLTVVADTLNLSPRRTVELLQQAMREGRTVDVVGDREIVWRPPEAPRWKTQITPASKGEDRAIGVFSDMHFGSVYNLGSELTKFVKGVYAEGIRDFFCPGDILEGRYKHARWELSHQSWEDQARSFLDALPKLPGARFHFIDGNHDFTWTESNGSESGRALVRMAKAEGRNDLFYFGSRGALIDYGGTLIELWHPKRGAAYALSYQLQNKVRDTAPERLPDILLTGHVHQYVALRRQNVWAFYCGTFQHGDGPYGRSLGGDVAMGGLVLRWRKDSDNVVRRLAHEFRVIEHVPEMHSSKPSYLEEP